MRPTTVCFTACTLLSLGGVAETRGVRPFHLLPVAADEKSDQATGDGELAFGQDD